MSYDLETFCKNCRKTLKADPGSAGHEEVRRNVEKLLADPGFCAAYLADGAQPGIRTVHRDPPHWMMGRPGLGVEDLRGKTVGSGDRGSDSALLVEAWLGQAGLEPGVDVSVSYHGANLSGCPDGSV